MEADPQSLSHNDDNGNEQLEHGESISFNEKHQKYEARKPKWWMKLSGRRGTRAQRQTIERMTECGYCFPRQVLSDFSRINNSAKHSSMQNDNSATDRWRRVWWNRSLGVLDDSEDASHVVLPIADTVSNSRNEKHAENIQSMYKNKSPLTPRKYDRIVLEIGFGSGDNILANSLNDRNTLFVGSEIHQPGCGAVLQKIEQVMATAEKEEDAANKHVYQNVRILQGDGIKLLSHLPGKYLDSILITFPDPWPKEGHAHWRVVQSNVLVEMHRVLKCDGKVLVATDAECFNDWTRDIFTHESSKGTWREVSCPDRAEWLPVISYYEQKGLDEGRYTMLQCWETTDADCA